MSITDTSWSISGIKSVLNTASTTSSAGGVGATEGAGSSYVPMVVSPGKEVLASFSWHIIFTAFVGLLTGIAGTSAPTNPQSTDSASASATTAPGPIPGQPAGSAAPSMSFVYQLQPCQALRDMAKMMITEIT